MTRISVIIMIIISCGLLSCGSSLNIRKSGLKCFDNKHYGYFSNYAFMTKPNRYGSPSLLELFEIYNVETDTVIIKVNTLSEIEVIYKDNMGIIVTKTYKGKFVKKGYYEILLRNYKKEIPPFFPFIFSRYNINKIKLGLTSEGDLIIDNTWNMSGNILFLGVGDKGRRRSYFHAYR